MEEEIDYKTLCKILDDYCFTESEEGITRNIVDGDLDFCVRYSQGGANGIETSNGTFKYGHTYPLLEVSVDTKYQSGLLLVEDVLGNEVWVNIQDFVVDEDEIERVALLKLMIGNYNAKIRTTRSN